MPNIGPAEILVILVVALLVFGPQKLPEIGRQVGKAARELRRMQASLRDEVRDVLEPVEEQGRPPKISTSTATEPDERALESGGEGDEGGDEDLSPLEEATSTADGDGDADGDGGATPPDGEGPTTRDTTS